MPIVDFINACKENTNTNISHVICTSKENILAEYIIEPYKRDTLKLFFSMTKSFAGLAVGIACDMGLLDLDDFIVGFFDKELPLLPHKNLKKIRIRHLLTMSCGIHDDTYRELVIQNDWVRAFLNQEFPHEPGTYYKYCTHGSHMLSAIITKVSKMSLEDFLNIHLFHPLGIFEAQWEQSPEGLTAGGMGLSLYPDSLVKIAQMLLNYGAYNGKQLISRKYIKMATEQQIVKQESSFFGGAGYGFQFHIGKEGFCRMDGAFGQLCLLCPANDLAVIVFSQCSKMEDLLSMIYKHLIYEDQSGKICLLDHNNFRVKVPGQVWFPLRKYRFNDNKWGIENVEFLFLDGVYQVIIKNRNGIEKILFSLDYDTNGKVKFIKDLQMHMQEYICRADFHESLVLTLFFIETPYVVKYNFAFEEEKISFGFSVNVSFTLENFIVKGFAQ